MSRRATPATTDLFARLAADRRGATAVEFALVLPVFLLLTVGASDVSLAVTLNRKLGGATATVADLVAQAPSTSASDLAVTLGVAAALIQPYDAAKLKTVLSSVTVDASGKARVDWSRAGGGAAAYTKNAVFTKLPAALASQAGRSFVVAEAAYTYTPLGGYGRTLAIPMQSIAYFTPRRATGPLACADC